MSVPELSPVPPPPAGDGLPAARTWPAAWNLVPKWALEDPTLFDEEISRIFEGSLWHVIGHVGELPEAGAFKTVRLGRTPLIVVRGEGEEGEDGPPIHVLHNSCAHRGTLLEPRFRGHAESFECPFHRWLFARDGRLLRCPGEREFPESFRREDHGLVQARVATFRGLIFASLSGPEAPPPPLEEWLGGAAEPLAAALGGDGRLRLLGYQKAIFQANWKIYIDDEGYHAPLLHKAFQILQWRGGSGTQVRYPNGHRVTRTASPGVRFDARMLRDPELLAYRGGGRPRNKYPDQGAGSLLVTPWPLGAVMNHLDILNIRLANPLDPLHTEVHYAYFAHADDDEEMVRHRVRQSSNLIGPSGFISLEDGAVFARMQRGAHARPEVLRYVRGWRDGPEYDPYHVSHNDETTNTVWWETYRRFMGFPRVEGGER